MWRLATTTWLLIVPASLATAGEEPALGRAIAYLCREVPRWSTEHHCYSCHNNGDAARALYAAVVARRPVASGALTATERWLASPDRWDHNGGDGPFSDKRLARVQFGAALAAAVAAGRVDKGPLRQAAARLAEDQDEDGSWPLEDGGSVGGPATYGRSLATALAAAMLRAADPERFREPIERADRWLRGRPIKTVLDASAVLLAAVEGDDRWDDERRSALAILRRGQADDGGWGPFVTAPPEVFDTALALLALRPLDDRPGVAAMIDRGRAFLVGAQLDDGSWPETTRPSGNESYAQRISTTGWATLALLATEGLNAARTDERPSPP